MANLVLVITSYSIHYTKLYEAGSLGSRKQARLFAVMLPNLSNPYFAELLDIIEQEAFV